MGSRFEGDGAGEDLVGGGVGAGKVNSVGGKINSGGEGLLRGLVGAGEAGEQPARASAAAARRAGMVFMSFIYLTVFFMLTGEDQSRKRQGGVSSLWTVFH